MSEAAYADAIYYAYATFISGAKAMLLSESKKANNQMSIIRAFDEHFVTTGAVAIDGGFEAHVLRIKEHEPTKDFAKTYIASAERFLQQVQKLREQQLATPS